MTAGRARGCALALVLGTLAVLAPNAGAVLIHGSGTVLGQPRVLSITLMAGKTPASLPPSLLYRPKANAIGFASNGNLDYNGGGVFHSQAPYLIFWDPSGAISSTTKTLIERYFADVAHDNGRSSNVYGMVRQYWDSHGFANYAQTFSAGTQAFVDTTGYPAKDTTNCINTNVPSGNPCLTDAQVTTELGNFITAHSLPHDGADPTNIPANAPEYFVVLPANVNECASGPTGGPGTQVCEDNAYCAYHSAFPFGSNGVIYSMIPLLGAVINGGSGSGKACQFDGLAPTVQEPNGDQQADVSLKSISHEQIESITDPLPPHSWISTEGSQTGHSGGEIGDQCNATGSFAPNTSGTNPNAFLPTLGGSAASLYDQLDNGHQYYIQSEWSNGNVNCEMQPSAGAVAAAFSAAAGPGSSVSLNPAGSSSTNGYSSVTWSLGDGATAFDHSGTAPGLAAHNYASGGTHNITLTLVDPMGNIGSTTHAVTTGLSPSAAFSSSVSGASVTLNAGGSTDPNSGGTITSYAWNFGDGHTGTGAAPTHAYVKGGNQTVTLAVTDSTGHQAIVSHTVTVASAIGKVKVNSKNGAGATIAVSVNAAGKLSGIGKSKNVPGPGTVRLKFKLSNAQKSALASLGHLTVKLKLEFALAAGGTATTKVTIRF
jgi:hypothetical protein